MKIINPIHRSDELHISAGSYYRNFYDDADRIFRIFDSFCWAYQSLLEESLDAAKLFLRTQIPPLHREAILRIVVDEDEYRNGKLQMLTYGTPNIYYGDKYYYGVPVRLMAGAVQLPDGVVDADLSCNLPRDPGIVLVKGEDFKIENGFLYFYEDIFEIFPTEGDAPYRTCTFWLRSAYIDRKYLQDRLGVLTRTYGESTEAYKRFCNLILDAIVEGTNYYRLLHLVCSLFDVPCSLDTEILEQVDTDWIATNKRVYAKPPAASFIYSPKDIGTTIQAGTILTDAIQSVRGSKLPDGIPIVFERRFLGLDFLAGLIFPNETVPLEYVNGQLRFKIVGREVDIERFWNKLYARAITPDILRAGILGERVNPAKFFYENILRPRAHFFVTNMRKTGPNRLSMANTQVFRRLLPPGILFSLLNVLEWDERNTQTFYMGGAFWGSKLYASAVLAHAEFSIVNTFNQVRACK